MFPLLGGGLAATFRSRFVLPESSPDPERYYAFRYAGALFIALDANQADSSSQLFWLTSRLEEAARDPSLEHVFVYMHHATFSSALLARATSLRDIPARSRAHRQAARRSDRPAANATRSGQRGC